ncbi:MAG: Ig-like domain-containing protein, partial [Gammaproteobacteria bacterium]|nr:Ig-like domain-containing protein [Gammaproteobacteria bacterium]
MTNLSKALSVFTLWLLIIALSGCGGGTSDPTTPGTDDPNSRQKILTGISLTIDSPILTTSTETQLAVTARFDDNSSEDITAQITWTVSDTKIATVSDTGLLKTDIYVAEILIIAEYQGKTVESTFVVNPQTDATLQSINLNGVTDLASLLDQQELVALGSYTDGSKSENLTVMVQRGSPDTLELQVGSAIFIASSTSVDTTSGTLTVDVAPSPNAPVTAILETITVTLPHATLVSNASMNATVTGAYDDGTVANPLTGVSWLRSGPVSIDANGKITAETVSTSTEASVTAYLGSKAAVTTFNVIPAEIIDPTSTTPILNSITISGVDSLNRDQEIYFTATGTYSDVSTQTLTNLVIWKSADESIVTVNSAGKLSPGTKAGTTTITATVTVAGTDIVAEKAITLNPISGINLSNVT